MYTQPHSSTFIALGVLGSKLSPGWEDFAGPQPLAISCSSHAGCGFHRTTLCKSFTSGLLHTHIFSWPRLLCERSLVNAYLTLLTSPSWRLPSGNSSSAWGQDGSSAFILTAHAGSSPDSRSLARAGYSINGRHRHCCDL